MKISEIAKETGLNISHIRFYERKGLLSPARSEENNYREYSEEDVLRIKKILLYRKMGISVETIYLLLNGQAELKEVLERQKAELKEQVVQLQGSIELCDMVMGEREPGPEQIDRYLCYVHREEEKGTRYAEIAELVEDITDFTRENVFHWDPVMVWLFSRPRTAGILAVLFWCLVLFFPVNHIVRASLGRTELNIAFLIIFGCIIAIYGWSFRIYRRGRKKYEKELSDYEAGEDE